MKLSLCRCSRLSLLSNLYIFVNMHVMYVVSICVLDTYFAIFPSLILVTCSSGASDSAASEYLSTIMSRVGDSPFSRPFPAVLKASILNGLRASSSMVSRDGSLHDVSYMNFLRGAHLWVMG